MKAKNGFIKNLRHLCLISIIALGLMTIVATGGGGGGDGTSGESGEPEETPSISITSIDNTSVAPLSLLTINGTGFDPQNSAISVLFMSQADDDALAVPAIFAGDSAVEVIVPPLVDPDSGLFSSGTVDIQVIQISESLLLTSNVITGLDISSLPSIDLSVPLGAVTRAFISAGLDSLEAAESLAELAPDADSFFTALNAYSSELESLLIQIDYLIDNPQQTVNLATTDGEPFVLDAADLDALDQLFSGYVSQLLAVLPAEATSQASEMRSVIQAETPSRCRSYTNTFSGSMPVIEQPCEADEQLAERAAEVGENMPKFAKVAYGGILTVASLGTTGALGTLFGAGRIGKVIISLGYSWLSDLLGGNSPTPQKSVGTVSKAIVDGELGVPILATMQPLIDLEKIMSEFRNPAPVTGQEPADGLVLTSSSATDIPSGYHEVTTIKESGDEFVSHTLPVPDTQESIPIGDGEVTFALFVGTGGDGSGAVTSDPAGINSGTDNSEIYDIGTAVILTATPEEDSTFTGWSGACTGTGSCVVAMDSDKAVTATFTIDDGGGDTPESGTASEDVSVATFTCSLITDENNNTFVILDAQGTGGGGNVNIITVFFRFAEDHLVSPETLDCGSWSQTGGLGTCTKGSASAETIKWDAWVKQFDNTPPSSITIEVKGWVSGNSTPLVSAENSATCR